MSGSTDGGGEATGSSVTMTTWLSSIDQYSNAAYNGILGGFALKDECTLSGATLDPGGTAMNKYFRTSSTVADPQILNLTSASSITTGTAANVTTFTNMTINLTGASHLDCAAAGTMRFVDCTINLSDTSYLTNAGTMSFDGCTITVAKAASITTSGTTTLTDCALTGTTDRTSALFSVTGGTTEVAGTTTITGITNTSGASGGSVFNVSAGTLKLAGGTISGCNIVAPQGINGGGSVAYVGNGTIELSGTTVSGCGNTTKEQYTCCPFVVAGSGTMNMTGGSITNCNGSHGGAVAVIGATSSLNMSGGSITGCAASYDGGALFAMNANATINMSGGSISGCTAKRSGSAISARADTVVNISGGSITGNRLSSTDGMGVSIAAVAGFDGIGTVTISGGPMISGNTTYAGAAADVMAYSATSLKIGDLTTSANVGITSSTPSLLAQDAQFAAASSGTASSTTSLDKLFNDSTSTLMGTAGTGSAVTWGTYVCQIRDDVTGTVLARYASLAAACAAVDDNQTIEMLQDVTQTAGITLPAKTFTITSMDSSASNTINRGYTGGSLFTTVSGTKLTMKGITVDGQKDTYSSDKPGGVLAVASGSTFVMGSGCTIQSSKASISGGGSTGAGAVYLLGTMEMHDGALGKGCTTTNNYGGFLYQEPGSTFTADGGELNGNSSASSGGAIMQATGGVCTTTLGGTFSATGNSCLANGAVIHGGAAGSAINIQGSATLKNNTCSSSSWSGGAVFAYNATVNIQDSPTITGNTNTDTDDASVTTRNVALTGGNGKLVVTGNLTGGEVGIYSGNYKAGTVFGSTSSDPATAYSGLERFTDDRDATLYGVAGSAANVIWGTTGPLRVYKHVSGTYADMTKSFSFTGTMTKASASAVTSFVATVCDADGNATGTTVTFTSGTPASFSLSDGQYLDLTDVLTGTTFSFAEDAADGYTLTLPTTDGWNAVGTGATLTTSGRVASGEVGTDLTRADFLNTKTDVPVTATKAGGSTAWPLMVGVTCGVLAVMVAWRLRRRRYVGSHLR
jgi:hypothetical protein